MVESVNLHCIFLIKGLHVVGDCPTATVGHEEFELGLREIGLLMVLNLLGKLSCINLFSRVVLAYSDVRIMEGRRLGSLIFLVLGGGYA